MTNLASAAAQQGDAADPRPLVTIITPSYNQAAFLRATLESVAVQDYPYLEHIVMDGGSTDGSREILEAWAKEHPILWRSEGDGGQADAIQRGAEMARGDIVGWLNSDDVLLDDRAISDMVDAFVPGVDAVSGAGWYIDVEGNRLARIPVFPSRLTYDVLRCVDWVLQPATFWRRGLMLEHPLDTSLHFAFDWDFFIRLSRSAEIAAFDREIAGYRLHGTGKTLTGGGRRLDELIEVTRRHNGERSARTIVLRSYCGVRRAAERLPRQLRYRAAGGLLAFATLTSRLTDGRGLQS